jgi:hypothetical protein
MPTRIESESDLAADLLPGVEAIAKFTGLKKRQVDWQIRNGNIPVTRMGRLIIGSKSALRRRFAVADERAPALPAAALEAKRRKAKAAAREVAS